MKKHKAEINTGLGRLITVQTMGNNEANIMISQLSIQNPNNVLNSIACALPMEQLDQLINHLRVVQLTIEANLFTHTTKEA